MKCALLIEDDPIVARLTRVLLARAGYETVWAETGRQAIDALSERRFPVIFVDLGLPDIDGSGVVIWLRHFEKERSHARAAVFVISANEVRASRALDVDGVLQKPLRMPALEQALQRTGSVEVNP